MEGSILGPVNFFVLLFSTLTPECRWPRRSPLVDSGDMPAADRRRAFSGPTTTLESAAMNVASALS